MANNTKAGHESRFCTTLRGHDSFDTTAICNIIDPHVHQTPPIPLDSSVNMADNDPIIVHVKKFHAQELKMGEPNLDGWALVSASGVSDAPPEAESFDVLSKLSNLADASGTTDDSSNVSFESAEDGTPAMPTPTKGPPPLAVSSETRRVAGSPSEWP